MLAYPRWHVIDPCSFLFGWQDEARNISVACIRARSYTSVLAALHETFLNDEHVLRDIFNPCSKVQSSYLMFVGQHKELAERLFSWQHK
jgi:hypothetical protein